MSQTSRTSPDTHAAKRLNSVGASVLAPPSTSAGTTAPDVLDDGFCSPDSWRTLAQKIRAANKVTFVGIVPRPLLEALTAVSEDDDGAGLPPFRYLTPLPEAILNGSEERALTRVAHRWQTGFMGLRNLVQARAQDALIDQELMGSLSSLPSVFLDCVIVIYGPPERTPTLAFFTELPSAPGNPARILRLSPTNTAIKQLVSHVEDVATTAPPLELREVLCKPHPEVGPCGSDPPSFAIKRLGPYGARVSDEVLKPVAVVVMCANSPEGRTVILKQRTPLTDNDDFGKLSLLSSRVQEADLAEAYRTRLPVGADPGKALTELWKAAGNPPAGWSLPMDAFQLAASREMFVTCGLEIGGDRLNFRGTYVIAHEARPDEQLGFVVYSVELQRDSFDEMEFALDRTPHALRAVLVRDLYHSGLELNRLLRTARSWLTEAVFQE